MGAAGNAFRGLPWPPPPACLQFHRTKRPVHAAGLNQARKPLYCASVGRWRRRAGRLGPLLEALDVRP